MDKCDRCGGPLGRHRRAEEGFLRVFIAEEIDPEKTTVAELVEKLRDNPESFYGGDEGAICVEIKYGINDLAYLSPLEGQEIHQYFMEIISKQSRVIKVLMSQVDDFIRENPKYIPRK